MYNFPQFNWNVDKLKIKRLVITRYNIILLKKPIMSEIMRQLTVPLYARPVSRFPTYNLSIKYYFSIKRNLFDFKISNYIIIIIISIFTQL